MQHVPSQATLNSSRIHAHRNAIVVCKRWNIIEELGTVLPTQNLKPEIFILKINGQEIPSLRRCFRNWTKRWALHHFNSSIGRPWTSPSLPTSRTILKLSSRNNCIQILCCLTLVIVLSLSKNTVLFYFKTQRFGDWILSSSSGNTFSFGPNRSENYHDRNHHWREEKLLMVPTQEKKIPLNLYLKELSCFFDICCDKGGPGGRDFQAGLSVRMV
jgi:hypothetical protein